VRREQFGLLEQKGKTAFIKGYSTSVIPKTTPMKPTV